MTKFLFPTKVLRLKSQISTLFRFPWCLANRWSEVRFDGTYRKQQIKEIFFNCLRLIREESQDTKTFSVCLMFLCGFNRFESDFNLAATAEKMIFVFDNFFAVSLAWILFRQVIAVKDFEPAASFSFAGRGWLRKFLKWLNETDGCMCKGKGQFFKQTSWSRARLAF